jgi:hypothetical protein
MFSIASMLANYPVVKGGAMQLLAKRDIRPPVPKGEVREGLRELIKAALAKKNNGLPTDVVEQLEGFMRAHPEKGGAPRKYDQPMRAGVTARFTDEQFRRIEIAASRAVPPLSPGQYVHNATLEVLAREGL